MKLLRKITDYATYRRTVRELSALDNNQLKDLGISRYEIPSIARAAIQ
jgi:uncharacterized protein YjiS (DUF1127 family)